MAELAGGRRARDEVGPCDRGRRRGSTSDGDGSDAGSAGAPHAASRSDQRAGDRRDGPGRHRHPSSVRVASSGSSTPASSAHSLQVLLELRVARLRVAGCRGRGPPGRAGSRGRRRTRGRTRSTRGRACTAPGRGTPASRSSVSGCPPSCGSRHLLPLRAGALGRLHLVLRRRPWPSTVRCPSTGSGTSTPWSRMQRANWSSASSRVERRAADDEALGVAAPVAPGRAVVGGSAEQAARRAGRPGRRARRAPRRRRWSDGGHGGAPRVRTDQMRLSPPRRPFGQRWLRDPDRAARLRWLNTAGPMLRGRPGSRRRCTCGCSWPRTRTSWPTPSRAGCAAPGTRRTSPSTAGPRWSSPGVNRYDVVLLDRDLPGGARRRRVPRARRGGHPRADPHADRGRRPGSEGRRLRARRRRLPRQAVRVRRAARAGPGARPSHRPRRSRRCWPRATCASTSPAAR